MCLLVILNYFNWFCMLFSATAWCDRNLDSLLEYISLFIIILLVYSSLTITFYSKCLYMFTIIIISLTSFKYHNCHLAHFPNNCPSKYLQIVMSGKPVHSVQRGNVDVASNRSNNNVDGKSLLLASSSIIHNYGILSIIL